MAQLRALTPEAHSLLGPYRRFLDGLEAELEARFRGTMADT
ncbi:MAG: hypothetical protein SFU83_08445 [Meiothermus sp.]|nr:hypothetical protein [Meiothermus sp.]